MSIAVFIDGTDAQQVTELKKFLKSYGAKVLDNTECSDANWPDELIKCIKYLNICWKDETIAEADAKDVLTSVASMFIQLPPNKLIEAVHLFCEKLLDFSGENIRRHKNKLFPLNLLFWGLNPKSHPRYEIFLTLIECAEKMGVLSEVITDPKKVASWLSECDCTVEECQKVWQKLYDAHIALGENRKAIEAMIYLLSTYNELTAVNARQNAIKCVISVLQDPCLLSHDQLYALKPVQYLEGEPVHDFFKIFVSGDLNTFKNFLAKHPNFLSHNNLSEEACVHKLRLLTLMQLSENVNELSYHDAATQLGLKIEELEPFIIEAVRQRAVACKLDQVQKKILITGAFPRTFGRPQWINLHDTLVQWRSHLGTVQSSLSMMIQNESS
ncbi:hypothetical protein MN116_005474 [Schistosoma mekongi]|uniref:Eukaryotic translation initiation factor 3 subunit M n=1 Tax=Schistosoma mekongi TaxID=38744 RepID=A0AAE2D6P0_SCHME|nr:hypothetical protein MN116_005474 [Schistosoma mekongi]